MAGRRSGDPAPWRPVDESRPIRWRSPSGGRRAAALLAGAVLAGCGGDAEETSGATIRDSAGIRIVENPAEPPARWSLGPEPLLDVGVVEGDEAYQLSDVTGAVWSARGELVVANRGTNEVRFYDADGRHVRSVGREGEGPGEFLALGSLERRGDSLIVHDGRGWRFTIYSNDGELLDTTPTDRPHIGLLSDGTLLSYGVLPEGPRSPGTYARSNGILIRDTGAIADTIARFRMFEAWTDTEVPGRSEPIFGHDTRVLVTGERVYVADNEAHEIRVLRSDGSLERVIRRTGAPRPLTEEDRDRFIDVRAQEYGDSPRAEVFMPAYRRQPARSTMPAFGRSGLVDDRLPWLLVDGMGRLWVLDYLAFPDETPTWIVYEPEGRLLAEVPTPVGLALTYADAERVVGIWRDALAVEHVRVYELVTSTP